ncbi:MAG TPA: hypothetical protein VFV70_02750, partial [Hyphomonadaceae bacterium]|nr:hypothetical protein [Hyphomonadaceae bacterium]
MSRMMMLAGVSLALTLAGCGDKKPMADAADTVANVPATQSAAGADTNASQHVPAATPAPAGPNAPPVDGEATLRLPASVVAGASVPVAWTGPSNAGDYVDLVPRGFADTRNEITYAYVRESDGTVSVRAPTAAGDYDVRYIVELPGGRKAKAVTPLTVTAAQATLQAPATATVGEALSVAWTGPSGQSDYIDVVKSGATATSGEITYAYADTGNPVKLEAPGIAGDYDIRYLLEGPGGRKVI